MTTSRYGLEAFTATFLETLLWSETDEQSDGGDGSYPPETEIDAAGLARLTEDCRQFYEENAGTWAWERKRGSEEWTDDQMAGHDFALTRNGHGAGFWDGGWHEAAGIVLTEACKAFGEVSLYRGDDGRVYVS